MASSSSSSSPPVAAATTTSSISSSGDKDSNINKKKRSSSSSSSLSVQQVVAGSSSSSSNKRVKLENSSSITSIDSSLSGQQQNVRVVARIRPLSQKEKKENSREVIGVVPSLDVTRTISIKTANTTTRTIGASGNSPKSFEYDGAFGPSTTQQELYQHTVGNMVRNNIFKGFNVTVMAYGQTGSGKTFTMGTEGGSDSGGDSQDNTTTTTTTTDFDPPSSTDGIIPRAVYDLFDQRRCMPDGEERVKIELSYLEIYNEEPTDLLLEEGEAKPNLHIRDGPDGGVVIQNLSTRVVTSPQDVCRLMNQAATRRATASTAMNAVSSRSHAICTLHVTIAPLSSAKTTTSASNDISMDSSTTEEKKDEELVEVEEEEMRAKLTLVDLAGSERIKRTGAEGKRMKEGININKGLFVLGQCVSALSELGQQGKSVGQGGSGSHVPYRSSKLTRILQDSLGGNSRTVMVACISPADSNVEETVNTLRYASRTRNIQNSAVRNVVASTISAAEAAALRRENESLKQQLAKAQEQLLKQQKVNATTTATTATTKPNTIQVTTATAAVPPPSILPLQIANPVVKTSTTTTATAGMIDVSKLDQIKQLQSTISSLESKIDLLEQQQQSAADDALEASIRADKFELRCQQVQEAAKLQGVTITTTSNTTSTTSTTSTEENGTGDTTTTTLDIVSRLRQEIVSLKTDLQDALADAAMARATAAAVVASNGDLASTAENFFLSSTSGEEGDNNNNKSLSELSTTTSNPSSDHDDAAAAAVVQEDKEEKLALTAELVAVSGGIEAKEAMAVQLNKERECMEAMRCHFENAVKSLQDEVDVLSAERSDLLTKVGEGDSHKMQKRIDELETRIKDLRSKAAEHTKSLRLREAAEKKCAKLAAEIQNDKKRRVALQKQLKEQATERRTEKMAAKKQAAKLLKDSNRLKMELEKVKNSAAKQAAVLRRKATEALNRQKREAELKAKKQQQQEERKNLAAKRANAKGKQTESTADSGSSRNVDDVRKEELTDWLDRELESAVAYQDLRQNIKQQKALLNEATVKKMQLQQKHTFNRSSGNLSINPPSISPTLKSLDEEIEMRSGLIEDLEDNLKELIKASSLSPKDKAPSGSSPAGINTSVLDNLSGGEAKFAVLNCFERVLRLKKTVETTEANSEEATTRAVNIALTKERRAHEEALMQLKMDHSQAMMDLLNSTKGSIEQSVRLTALDSVVDADFQATVEQMLSGYLDGSTSAFSSVQGELQQVKEAQAGMKQIVESVASDIIQKTGTSPKPKPKKKKKPKQRESTDSLLEEIELLEAEEAEQDNSDDSDWSPSNKTPGPRRRNRKSADSVAKDSKPKAKSAATMMAEAAAASAAAAETLCTTLDQIMETNDEKEQAKDAKSSSTSTVTDTRPDDPSSVAAGAEPMEEEESTTTKSEMVYEKLKVYELRELLRARELAVSGNKSSLISRLRDHDKEQAQDSDSSEKAKIPTRSDSFKKATVASRGRSKSKENRRVTRSSSGRADRPKDASDIDANKKPGAKGKAKKAVVLPSTPPQTTKKGTEYSTKKIASVRRSTMFARKPRDLSLSPDPENEKDEDNHASSPNPGTTNLNNNNEENEGVAMVETKPKPGGGLRLRRNLQNQLSKAGGSNKSGGSAMMTKAGNAGSSSNGINANTKTRGVRALQQLERNFIP